MFVGKEVSNLDRRIYFLLAICIALLLFTVSALNVPINKDIIPDGPLGVLLPNISEPIGSGILDNTSPQTTPSPTPSEPTQASSPAPTQEMIFQTQDSTGNKVELLNNNGSVNATYTNISACANVVSAGQTCLVYDGEYNEKITISRNGSVSNYTSFNASGQVIMNGFTITNKRYVRISGFDITKTDADGIYLVNTSSIDILNNKIYNTSDLCIRLHPSGMSSNITIRNNTMRYCGYFTFTPSAAIYAYGNNNLIEQNDASETNDFVPVFGSTASKITKATFDTTIKFANQRAQRNHALNKCIEDPEHCDTEGISGY